MKSTEQIFWEGDAKPSHVHQHLCCSPILHCLTPTISFSTWLTFAIRKRNLPTCGKRAPIPKGKAPAMLKCPHRDRNDVPCPMSSSGDWGGFILTPEEHKGQSNTSPQPPAARTTLSCYQIFLQKPFFQTYSVERSLISLLNPKYYLPAHFTWTGTTILSTAGL